MDADKQIQIQSVVEGQNRDFYNTSVLINLIRKLSTQSGFRFQLKIVHKQRWTNKGKTACMHTMHTFKHSNNLLCHYKVKTLNKFVRTCGHVMSFDEKR